MGKTNYMLKGCCDMGEEQVNSSNGLSFKVNIDVVEGLKSVEEIRRLAEATTILLYTV
ncbi:hypothetical protein [Brevibacillus laterosporus]|uniref:hypothetical protein n=1 Tax=Brevibacillus laterosporus TaxID=1465 RepID=UPI00159650CC|nr:hypothetical protein [Brevibacillus laterosporus]